MTVDSTQKSGNETLVIFRTTDPIGPLLDQRRGTAIISAELNGLYVPAGAITTNNNLTGVIVYDGADGVFVPVEVISPEGGSVLVTPTVDGMLVPGNYVLVR